MKHLGRNETSQSLPDTVIVDGQQLVYHVHWPCGGNASVLAASMKSRLDRYSSKVVQTNTKTHLQKIMNEHVVVVLAQ